MMQTWELFSEENTKGDVPYGDFLELKEQALPIYTVVMCLSLEFLPTCSFSVSLEELIAALLKLQ